MIAHTRKLWEQYDRQPPFGSSHGVAKDFPRELTIESKTIVEHHRVFRPSGA